MEHARQDLFGGPAPAGVLTQEGRRTDIWEIPLLLKYEGKARGFRPFAAAGNTLRRAGDLDVDLITIPTFPNSVATRQRFTAPLGGPIRYGVTLAGGLSWKLRVVRLEPELRYTHWTAHRWMATTEQIEFLLGVKLPIGRAQ